MQATCPGASPFRIALFERMLIARLTGVREQMDGMLEKRHFDEAMKTARKSVSKTELKRYLQFKKELSGGGGLKQAAAAADAAAAAAEDGEEAPSAQPAAPDASDEELYD